MLNYTFLHPLYFIVIVPVLLLILFLYFKKSKISNFGPFEDLRKIYRKNNIYYRLYFVSLFIISLLFISVLANFTENRTSEKIKKKGIDIEIVLDLSYSMKADDIKPNRLEAGKEVLINFIDSVESDRIGLVLFSGKPFNSIPLTFDYDFLKDFVGDLSVNTINQAYSHLAGTAIGDAIVLGIDSFKKSDDREKMMILITDGEANKGLDPMLALKMAKKEGIKIYTIGVGGDKPVYIDVNIGGFFPQRVKIGGIDEDTLKKIASETGGKYFRATSKDRLDEIFKDISKLEKKDIEINEIKTQKDRNIFFVYFIVFFMMVLVGLKYWKRV